MSDLMAYRLRRSLRAKQLQVRISPWQGIEVVIPAHTSRQRVRSFLNKQRRWIRDTWQHMRSQVIDADQRLPKKLNLQAIGENWHVHYRRRPVKQVHIITHGHNLFIYHAGDDEAACRTALRIWLIRKAHEHLGAKARRMSAALACRYQRLQIRGQTSRWGSCSSNGTLSLNYKLLFVEPSLVRYLLVHELTHLRILDHSARFWRAVALREPRWRKLDAELGEAWRDVPAWVELT